MLRPTTCSAKLTLGFLAAATLLVPSAGYAADISTPALRYDLSFVEPASALATEADAAPEALATADPAALECMAKVVHHESRGQPRRGMLAVAQTLVNRLHAGGRFGDSICAVANQPGQFFKTASYKPARGDDWDEAVDIARAALNGEAEDAAPGAMYFRAASGTQSGFFRSRQRIAAIGGQVFYR